MGPYRTPAPMPPPESEPVLPNPDRWLMRFLWTVLALVVALIGCKAYLAYRDGPAPPAPCSSYAEWPAKDIPARCTKNFDGDKP